MGAAKKLSQKRRHPIPLTAPIFGRAKPHTIYALRKLSSRLLKETSARFARPAPRRPFRPPAELATDRRRSSMRMLCLETGVSRRVSADNSGLSTVRAAERTCIVTNIKLLHGVASPPKATNKWS